MDNLLLAFCSCLSCFIIVRILFQFMNDRYSKSFCNKYIYYMTEGGTVLIISIINLINYSTLNIISWVVSVMIISSVLYFDESDNLLRRIIECEVLLLCMGACEALGVTFVDWILKVFEISMGSDVMRSCIEITFSKIVMIFLYYMAFARLMSKKKASFTKIQWIVSFIILIYSVVNILVIVKGIQRGENQSILTINMSCIVIADLYLLYFIKVANEKNYLEGELKILEKQAYMQYKYYLAQEQKYNATVNILHDVNKHVTSIEKLYMSGEGNIATDYVREINNMLESLIPIKYTGNPILDILLADKATISKEKKIDFDVNVENVNLDFLEAIDVTTIFGNLIDNAIEAAEKVNENRFIHISISPYQEMVLIRIENTSYPINCINGIPVSTKGNDHGIGLLNVRRCIEKYDGDITFSQSEKVVIVELLLNS